MYGVSGADDEEARRRRAREPLDELRARLERIAERSGRDATGRVGKSAGHWSKFGHSSTTASYIRITPQRGGVMRMRR